MLPYCVDVESKIKAFVYGLTSRSGRLYDTNRLRARLNLPGKNPLWRGEDDLEHLRAILLTMRPWQWVKNVFVLAPLVFARKATDIDSVTTALLAGLLFCLISGTVYLLNDVLDREQDAQHPEKCNRPIASGALPARTALIAAFAILSTASGFALLWRPAFGVVLLVYLLLNVAYSLWLKRIPVLDVMLIALGFLLRVVGGALAISVVISNWILACAFLLASYLGLGKRVHEARVLSAASSRTRSVLKYYRHRFVYFVFGLVGVASWGGYLAYSMSSHVEMSFKTNLLWTTPFAALGLFRFAQLAYSKSVHKSPTDALVSDPVVLGTILVWAVVTFLLLY